MMFLLKSLHESPQYNLLSYSKLDLIHIVVIYLERFYSEMPSIYLLIYIINLTILILLS